MNFREKLEALQREKKAQFLGYKTAEGILTEVIDELKKLSSDYFVEIQTLKFKLSNDWISVAINGSEDSEFYQRLVQDDLVGKHTFCTIQRQLEQEQFNILYVSKECFEIELPNY